MKLSAFIFMSLFVQLSWSSVSTCETETLNILQALEARVELNMLEQGRYQRAARRSVEARIRAQVQAILRTGGRNIKESEVKLLEDYASFVTQHQMGTPSITRAARELAEQYRFQNMNSRQLAHHIFEHFNHLPGSRIIIHPAVEEELSHFPPALLRNLYRNLFNLQTSESLVSLTSMQHGLLQIRVARHAAVGAPRVLLTRNSNGQYIILHAFIKKINHGISDEYQRNIINRLNSL